MTPFERAVLRVKAAASGGAACVVVGGLIDRAYVAMGRARRPSQRAVRTLKKIDHVFERKCVSRRRFPT